MAARRHQCSALVSAVLIDQGAARAQVALPFVVFFVIAYVVYGHQPAVGGVIVDKELGPIVERTVALRPYRR